MSTISGLKTWADREELDAPDLNANFSTIVDTYNAFSVLTDVPRTVNTVVTFAVAPVFQASPSFGSQLVVTAGGASITGTVVLNNALGVGGVATLGALLVETVATVEGFFTVNDNASVTGNLVVGGTGLFGGAVTAPSFIGLGASLTALAAANITPGGTLPALVGTALTALNMSNATTGTLNATLLPLVIGTRESAQFTLKNGGTGLVFDTDYALTAGAQSLPSFTGTGPVAGLVNVRWIRVSSAGLATYLLGFSA